MEKVKTIEIPEELLMAMHIYVEAAHGMAKLASQQPKELKGKKPRDIFDITILAVVKAFEAKPQAEQIRLLIETARKLAETWEAMTPEEMAKMIADIWAALDSYAFGSGSGDVGGGDDAPTVPDLGEDVFIDRQRPPVGFLPLTGPQKLPP